MVGTGRLHDGDRRGLAAVTEAVAVAETGVPDGAWPVAVAESATEPWFMSAWDTV